MKIAINDNRKIFSIQEEFNLTFPFLKLEFFCMSHTFGCTFSKKIIKENTKALSACRTVHNEGEIVIIPNMTVYDLEQNFSNVYGLAVQVSRKSGRIWLETTVTDSWTLAEQNNQGESLSKAIA